MEEVRPGKKFWEVMINYTLVILFLKFIIQLDFWLNYPELCSNAASISEWVLFGLWRTESVGELLGYIIPEILILAAIMGQCFYETLIGLHEKREVEIENIQQAKERFIRSQQNEGDLISKTIVKKKNPKLAL